MKVEFVFYFLSSFLISAAIIPLIIYLSGKFKLFDYIDERKIHNGNKSRLGGLAIFISFLLVAVFIFIRYNININIYLYMLAVATAFMTGFIDDLRSLRCITKLALQIISAVLAISSGLIIREVNFFGLVNIDFGFFSYAITAVWIVLFMNAVNLIDGMDGLASCLIFAASVFICVTGFVNDNLPVVILSLILQGGILGFIMFNFPPAKIFMGDGGAYFIGFTYSTIPLIGTATQMSSSILILSFFIMLIPILDIIKVMFIRIKENRSIFSPDTNHIHHKLLKIGFTPKSILLIVTSSTAILSMLLMALVRTRLDFYLNLFFLFCAIMLILYNNLGDIKQRMDSVRNGRSVKEKYKILNAAFLKR